MEALFSFWDINLIQTANGLTISIGDGVLALLLLLMAYVLSRLGQYFLVKKLANTRLRPDAIEVIKRVLFYIILVLIGLTILGLLGIPITVFAFATGAIAIGVGFGAQNVINNFISGWILIAERPIRTEDFIEIDGAMGVVERVGTRSTRIRRTDGVHMLVPNSRLLENTVVNWTLLDKRIRTSIRVGVAYGSDPGQVIELFKQAVIAQREVLQDPLPEFIFEEFGDNALIFDAFFWCDMLGEKTLRVIRSEIRFRINQAFSEQNIVIAYPQRDIHLHTQKPIPVSIESSAD